MKYEPEAGNGIIPGQGPRIALSGDKKKAVENADKETGENGEPPQLVESNATYKPVVPISHFLTTNSPEALYLPKDLRVRATTLRGV